MIVDRMHHGSAWLLTARPYDTGEHVSTVVDARDAARYCRGRLRLTFATLSGRCAPDAAVTLHAEGRASSASPWEPLGAPRGLVIGGPQQQMHDMPWAAQVRCRAVVDRGPVHFGAQLDSSAGYRQPEGS